MYIFSSFIYIYRDSWNENFMHWAHRPRNEFYFGRKGKIGSILFNEKGNVIFRFHKLINDNCMIWINLWNTYWKKKTKREKESWRDEIFEQVVNQTDKKHERQAIPIIFFLFWN